MHMILLVLVLLLGLLMIPIGLPGTWILAGAALGYSIFVPGTIGTVTVVLVSVLAIVGEVLEFSVASRYTRKFGGSTRASWGAIIGGIVGAVIGVPIPIVGSVIGAFAGAFVGAFVAELSLGVDGGNPGRAATGALIGRAVASAMKVGLGMAMAVWILVAAIT